ncbi:MAG TPA: hypothetical protein VGT41_00565, partial [Candidatus Babeliales bacterium]|nr:hypothetical protein [Candidatus Babeliales bacterium]
MNYFKVLSKSFGIFFLIAALFYGICIPHQVKASIGVPFGGFDVGDDYEVCDCSGAVYSWFAPLYFGPTPATGALSWFPGTIEFSYYLPHPGAALLGTYIP